MKSEKFAVITGGSEGVGFAVAEMLARNNFHIFLVARDAEKLAAAQARLSEFEVTTLSCDVTNIAAVQALREQVAAVTDHIDVLVNSAGTFKWDNSGVDLQLLNATSKEYVARAFASMLKKGAKVINVSSQAAFFTDEDPRCIDEWEYVKSMRRVDAFSAEFAFEYPDVAVYVTHPPLMRGKIAEEQFRGRAGFESVDFARLPGPEIVAQELEEKFWV